MSQPARTASRRRVVALSAAIAFATAAALGSLFVTETGSVQSIIGTVGYSLVGAVILRQRPGNGIGRLALAIGLAYSTSAVVASVVSALTPPGAAFPVVPGSVMLLVELAVDASELLQMATLAIGTTLLVTWFPSGRRTSRLGALVELGLVATIVVVALVVLKDPILRTLGWSPALGTILSVAEPLAFALLAGTWGVAVLDLLVRYGSASAIERVQMRWVVASIVASTALIVLLAPFGAALPGIWDLWILTMTLPVVAIAVAITRYRLYDIDHLVSRSISYGLITAVLFAVFFVLNVGLQTLVGGATGDSPAIVAISTLAVAALFQPLRVRVQRAVDRRFNRAHIDTERTVASYAGRLREELDLHTLIGELERTTSAAVEPTRTVVWLRPAADRAS